MFSKEQEQFYADHLIDYINKDEMISLPVASMYRILDIYKKKNGMDIKEKDKIGSFLCKYFKTYGDNSVILFLIFNISNMDFDYFDIFLTYCSDSFDYLSIQKLLIKTIIDLTNATKSQKEQIDELKKLLIKQNNEMKKIISDQNMFIQQNTQNQIEINDLKKIVQEQSEQIAILANMPNDINDLKATIQEQSEQIAILANMQNDINDLKATIQEQSEQIAILANMQNDILNSNEQNNSRYEVTFSSINEELNQNKTNIRQQNNEINDLKNKSTRQNDKITKLKTNIQSSIKELHDELEQFHIELDEKTKIKYINDFEYTGSNKFNGIINYLSKQCNGNVHQKGIVNVTASSIYKCYLPKYIVELNNCSNYFHSQNQRNSWIQYDFKDYKVRPTAYSIRTRHDYGKGHCQPKNWCIEGSNDRINWTVLDIQKNITYLDGTNLSHTFNIEKDLEEKDCYKYLRYRQIGVETQGNYHLVLSALEFFGSLILI